MKRLNFRTSLLNGFLLVALLLETNQGTHMLQPAGAQVASGRTAQPSGE